MKRSDYFDNLNVMFSDANEDDEYAFTKAVIYRNLETGEIDSVQVINTEYREFLIVDRNGEVSVASMDEEEQESLSGDTSAKKKYKRKK